MIFWTASEKRFALAALNRFDDENAAIVQAINVAKNTAARAACQVSGVSNDPAMTGRDVARHQSVRSARQPTEIIAIIANFST